MAENRSESTVRRTSKQPLPTVNNVEPNTFETLGERPIITMLKEQKLCDVTFVVGPTKKEIKCHRLVLMARSDVFETMFSERWNSTSVVDLPETDPQVFHLFLMFIYGDEYTGSAPMAIKLLELAHKYNVKALVKKCEELLSQDLKIQDYIEIFKLARHYSLDSLMERAGNLMASSFVALSNDVTFREMDEATLIHLLQRDDLPVLEIHLFTTILRWAGDNMGTSESFAQGLKNIIPFIRFPLMSAEEFATEVVPIELLPEKDVIRLFLYFNSKGVVREIAARSLQFSSIPRKGQRPIAVEVNEIPGGSIRCGKLPWHMFWSEEDLAEMSNSR